MAHKKCNRFIDTTTGKIRVKKREKNEKKKNKIPVSYVKITRSGIFLPYIDNTNDRQTSQPNYFVTPFSKLQHGSNMSSGKLI